MKESLMTNNNNEDNKEKKLLKDAKKMHYIKYLNLFFSILRTVLEFYQIINNIEFAFYLLFNIFLLMVLFHLYIILPISAIINLIKTFRRIFKRNYSISKNVENIYDCIGYTCCGNDNSNNVTFSKYSNLIYGLITLFLSSFSLFFFLKDRIYYSNKYKNAPFLSDEQRKQLTIIILYLIDSIILLIQSYFFHFHDYFLRRGEIFIEFYKRLIIKNRKEEAEFVRNQLPRNIDDFEINSGQKMKDIAV